MSEVRVLNSVREMHELAAEVAGQLKPGIVLLLVGDLGAGKTTFTQGLAKALGIREQVSSPTFSIVSEYETGDNGGDIARLVHVDLYRLANDEVVGEAAVREVLDEAPGLAGVTVIEWADKLGSIEIKNAVRIEFNHEEKEGQRRVIIG